MKTVRRVDIEEVKRLHRGYFFSPDTMRFFHSRLAQYAWRVGDDVWYFVTSELPPFQPRRWTIRRMQKEGDSYPIETPRDAFGEFRSSATAQRHCQRAAYDEANRTE